MANLPVLADGTVNNGPLSGGYDTSFNTHINSDGTVATSTTKQGGAFLSSNGWLVNPDKSIVITMGAPAGGAQLTQCGVLTNPDGTACASTSPSGAFINSRGVKINPNGAMIVNNGTT